MLQNRVINLQSNVGKIFPGCSHDTPLLENIFANGQHCWQKTYHLPAASRLGLFFPSMLFWKMEVSQVMPISPLARMASVVISSVPGPLFLGLVFMACWTSDLRMIGSSSLSS